MNIPKVKIDDNGIRPAGKPDQCFYCGSKVGFPHKEDCVIVHKLVRVKATVEFNISVPHFWTEENIRFRYNDGTWCGDNLPHLLEAHVERQEKAECGCLCSSTKIEYIGVVDETPNTDEELTESDKMCGFMHELKAKLLNIHGNRTDSYKVRSQVEAILNKLEEFDL